MRRGLAVVASTSFTVALVACASLSGLSGNADAGSRDAPATDARATDARHADARPAMDGSRADARAPHDSGSDAAHDAGADAALHDAAAAVPASCKTLGAGRSDCGPDAGESCCTTGEVVGGTYYRTYTNTGGSVLDESAPATVDSFLLDKYLVTVGRFREFVAAVRVGYAPTPGSGIHGYLNGGLGLVNGEGDGGAYETGWEAVFSGNVALTGDGPLQSCGSSTWTAAVSSQEKLPINCVNWFEAYAFCIWDGGFLASEAELVLAAAGGAQQREYPWGSTTPTLAYSINSCGYPDSSVDCTDGGVGNIAPVGSAGLGAGLWGQLDLVGDVATLGADWFWNSYPMPCTNCAALGQSPQGERVVRGGTYAGGTPTQISRPQDEPLNRSNFWGVRCARSP